MTDPRRNVELKARDAHPERSLATCEALGAKAEGVLVQRDTYFHAREGRLKLREERGATAQLIAYERADLSGRRTSHYRLIDVGEPEELKAALATTLGVEVVVAKERRLFLWDGSVRIHLDAVEGLGDFIEFEAVAPGDSDLEREEAQVARLREAFEIDDADVVGESYCDLMLTAKAGEGVEPGEERGERLERQLGFILEIDKLKSVVRQTLLNDGSRRENDAEHSWELATMAVVLAEHAGAPIDLPRVVRMLLVHDIVEIDAGDTFLYDEEATKTKAEREERAAERIFSLLPGDQAADLCELWVEFEGMKSAEARFARALDRLAPLLHNYHSGGATWREHSLDYGRVRDGTRSSAVARRCCGPTPRKS